MDGKNKAYWKGQIRKRLTHKFKLILLDEKNFHEAFSFRLKLINLMILVAVLSILLVGATILLIRYTSLNEYISGNADISEMKKGSIVLAMQIDSLEEKLYQNDRFILGLRLAMADQIPVDSIAERKMVDSVAAKVDINTDISKADSAFRAQIEQQDMIYINAANESQKSELSLFPPIRNGFISAGFDPQQGHTAIDISTAQYSPIFSIAAGTVIFKDWSPNYGNILIIEHDKSLLSIYKHIASSSVETGERVSQGELIALSGNTGELTTGPHLHFELWIDGRAVNPEDYFHFDK